YEAYCGILRCIVVCEHCIKNKKLYSHAYIFCIVNRLFGISHVNIWFGLPSNHPGYPFPTFVVNPLEKMMEDIPEPRLGGQIGR
ncbi:hypothetical protein Leryth_026841, partial [Lithospermum erythrorhizon]